jgi:hypothetical protein
MGFDYYLDAPDVQNGPLVEMINSRDNTQTIQAFAEWQFKTFGHFTFNIGGHYLQLAYNHSYSIEPRVSLKYDFKTSNIAFAYGEHSQIQGLGTYFAQVKNSNGNIEYVNHDLNFTKARHFVLSVQHSFTDNMGLKAELYDQELYNVPISLTDSTFSILNVEKDYVTEALVNQGKGRNYGLEISLEKHLSNYLYYMISGSWYQSKFTAADGIERNTRFNGNYLYNLVAGKDFPTKNKLKTFGVNVKVIYSGGLRSIPVDLQKSIQQGYTILDKKDEYTLQNPPYFRPDLRLNYTWNKKHHTSTLSLDIQNLINRKNAELPFFIAEKKIVVYSNQNGIIPVLNYKIDF